MLPTHHKKTIIFLAPWLILKRGSVAQCLGPGGRVASEFDSATYYLRNPAQMAKPAFPYLQKGEAWIMTIAASPEDHGGARQLAHRRAGGSPPCLTPPALTLGLLISSGSRSSGPSWGLACEGTNASVAHRGPVDLAFASVPRSDHTDLL